MTDDRSATLMTSRPPEEFSDAERVANLQRLTGSWMRGAIRNRIDRLQTRLVLLTIAAGALILTVEAWVIITEAPFWIGCVLLAALFCLLVTQLTIIKVQRARIGLHGITPPDPGELDRMADGHRYD